MVFMFFQIDLFLLYVLWYLFMKRITVEELYRDASLYKQFLLKYVLWNAYNYTLWEASQIILFNKIKIYKNVIKLILKY